MSIRKIKKKRWVDTPAFGNTIGLGLIVAAIVTIGVLYPRNAQSENHNVAKPEINIFVVKEKPLTKERCDEFLTVATESMYKRQYSESDAIEVADSYGVKGDIEARMIALEAFTYPVRPERADKNEMIMNFSMLKTGMCHKALKMM